MNIALDSLKLGNHWLRYDGRAKRVKFLYFDVGMDEIVSVAWAINETWRKSLEENPTQPSDGKAGASASSKDKSTPSNKGTPKGAGKQTGSPDQKKNCSNCLRLGEKAPTRHRLEARIRPQQNCSHSQKKRRVIMLS